MVQEEIGREAGLTECRPLNWLGSKDQDTDLQVSCLEGVKCGYADLVA